MMSPMLIASAFCLFQPAGLAADAASNAAAYAPDSSALIEPAYIAPRAVKTKALVSSLRHQMASATGAEDRLAVLDDLTTTDWNTLTVALFRVDNCQVGNLPSGLFEAQAELLGLSADGVWPLRFRLNNGMTPAFKRFANAGQTVTNSTTFKLKDCE